jgi:CcmD family protein
MLRRLVMNTMNYLFSAYAAFWIILGVYLFSIHARERKLRSEIERLKQILEATNRGRPTANDAG